MNPCAGAKRLNWHEVSLCVALLLGLLLRLHGLSAESPWHDEILTLRNLDAPSFREYMLGVRADDPPLRLAPGYYTALWGWSRVFGSEVLCARAFSVALGTLAIFLLARFTGARFSPPAGSAAAFALALSLINIYFSQEVRFYALLNTLALCSMLALWHALHRCSPVVWALHLSANALLLAAHTFTCFFFLAQGVYLLFFHRRPRLLAAWGGVHAAIFAVLALWARFSLQYDLGSSSQAFHDQGPSWREMANVLVRFAGGRFGKEDPSAWIPGGFSMDLPITTLVLPLAAYAVWRTFRKRNQEPARWEATVLCLSWFAVPLASLYIASELWRPVFFARYVLYSSLALIALAAAGLTLVPRRVPRIALASMLGTLLLYQNLALPRPFRADYQSAMAQIEAELGPKTRILALKHFTDWAARYNMKHEEDRITGYHGFQELCTDTLAAVTQGTDVWVLFDRWDRLDVFEQRLREAGFNFSRHPFAGMPPIAAYHVLPALKAGSQVIQ